MYENPQVSFMSGVVNQKRRIQLRNKRNKAFLKFWKIILKIPININGENCKDRQDDKESPTEDVFENPKSKICDDMQFSEN